LGSLKINTKQMSRITKTLAHQVALKLAAPILNRAEKLEKELEDLITPLYEATLPKEVLSAFKKYPKYFNNYSYVRVSGPGLKEWNSFNLSKGLPRKENSYGNLTVPQEIADKIVDLENRISSTKEEYRKHRSEIEIAVFGLRTYGKVQLEFPEAFDLLPPITTTALTVDLKSIRCKIDKKNCAA
jgi:hypothetical protein